MNGNSIRQFLYVDVDRTRSYLAQLDRGVLETVREQANSEARGSLSAKFLGLGGELGAGGTHAVEESRSLQDLVFVLFEEVAEKAGFIVDLEASVRDPASWTSSAVHDGLGEGQLIRVTSDIQVLDPRFFTARLDRIRQFSRSLVDLQVDDQQAGAQRRPSQRDRDRLAEKLEREMWSGTDPAVVTRIAQVMSSLSSGEIALRVIPCGNDKPELSFGGILLDRADYLQKEREALFSRFGSVLSGWTVVMQVEAIPYAVDGLAQFDPTGMMFDDRSINRAAAERMCLDLLRFIDSSGMTEGPLWPSITVTPIGVYRDVPPAP
jgi:hypothetical protein